MLKKKQIRTSRIENLTLILIIKLSAKNIRLDIVEERIYELKINLKKLFRMKCRNEVMEN